jgi:hypothetical protein
MEFSLVRQIGEVGEEPLHFDPGDFQAEYRVNAWWVSCSEEECAALSVAVVVEAYERCVERIRQRLRDSGHETPAVFYGWHDELAGQLRSNTTSIAADQLPFGVSVVPATLETIVEGYLRTVDGNPEPIVQVWAVSVA